MILRISHVVTLSLTLLHTLTYAQVPPVAPDLPECYVGLPPKAYLFLFGASGTLPNDLGSYTDCLDQDWTKYCVLKAGASNVEMNKVIIPSFKLGVCAPKSCSTQDAEAWVYKALPLVTERYLNATIYRAGATECGNQAQPWSVGSHFMVTLTCLLAVTAIVAGIYHTIVDHNCARRGVRPPGEKDWSLGMKIFMAFSSRRNWRSFWRLRPERGQLDHLDGVRGMSMLWVLFGHTDFYALGAGGLSFYTQIARKLKTVLYQLLPAAFFSVDSFFYLSGLLTTKALLSQLPKRGLKIYPVYILARWLRLSVLLLFVIGFGQHVVPLFGRGPLWSDVGPNIGPCGEYWWQNMLYIQNFTTDNAMCLGHTWYLAPDMQFYILLPFFVVVYVYHRMSGVMLVAILTMASTASNIILTLKYDFTASPLTSPDYFNYVYIKPYTRAQPWLMGILTSYILQYLNERSDNSRWHKTPRSVIWFWWALIGATFSACAFGTISLYQDPTNPTWSTFQNVAYISFSRLGWGMALCGMTVLCATGHGGYVNRILNRPNWQIFGKLTYGSYLIHPLVLVTVYYSQKNWVLYSDLWYATHFTAFVVWVTILAFILWMIVEKPAANLQMILISALGGRKKSKDEDEMPLTKSVDDDRQKDSEYEAPLLANASADLSLNADVVSTKA